MSAPQVHDDDGLRLDDQLCFALYAASTAMTRRYRAPLAAIGLTYPQYLVMLTLWQDGASTVGRLASRLGLDSHAVSPVVTRLEASGLVTRTRGRDRRTVHVQATSQGRALESSAARVQADVACATGLSPDGLAALRSRLHDLARELTTPAPPSPPGRVRADRA